MSKSSLDTKKIIRIISSVLALVGGVVWYQVAFDGGYSEPVRQGQASPAEAGAVKKGRPSVLIRPSAEGTPTSVVISREKEPERRRCVFSSFKDGEWVMGWGWVKKLLPDDTVPPCHQRFLLVDPTGETLLVANNIDRWPRLANLNVGDVVEFKGEFKIGERGYLVHWTHPDTTGRRPGGYVRKGK